MYTEYIASVRFYSGLVSLSNRIISFKHSLSSFIYLDDLLLKIEQNHVQFHINITEYPNSIELK